MLMVGIMVYAVAAAAFYLSMDKIAVPDPEMNVVETVPLQVVAGGLSEHREAA